MSMTKAVIPTSSRSTRWRSRMAIEVATGTKATDSTTRTSTRDDPGPTKPGRIGKP